MKLSEFILEAEGGYKNLIEGPDWLDQLYKAKKWDPELRETIQLFISEIMKDHVRLIYSDKSNDVKIPRAYAQEVQDYCKSHPDFSIRGESVKILGKPLFRIGNGSVGRINTDVQERATCEVWNAWERGTDPLPENMDYLNIGDRSWLLSFRNQVLAIEQKIGQGYTAERYGEGPVGKAYKKMIDALVKAIKIETEEKVQKDTIDPTDIVLYKDQSVIKDLQELTNQWDPVKYLELFNDRKIVGVSLKKAAGEAEFKNLQKIEVTIRDIEEPVRTLPKNKNDKEGKGVSCWVDTNLGRYKVTYRSFYGNEVGGMDISDGGPSLGKVPVWYWTKTGKIDKKLSKGIEDFEKLAKSKNKKIFTRFIELGAKINSPVPYLLVK